MQKQDRFESAHCSQRRKMAKQNTMACQGQGHKVANADITWQSLTQGICIQNMNLLTIYMQGLWTEVQTYLKQYVPDRSTCCIFRGGHEVMTMGTR